MLHEELRETAKYNSVIRAIALGATSLNEIATHTMMANATVSSYLANLMELGIVEREFPVTAKPKERAKGSRGLYQLSDNFFRFWYSFVFPYRSELERGDVEGVYERHIKPVLHDFAGNRSRVCAVNGCGVRVLLDGCPSVRVRLAVGGIVRMR